MKSSLFYCCCFDGTGKKLSDLGKNNNLPFAEKAN